MKKILILSNSSTGLYEFRNELLLNLIQDNEIYISLPQKDKYFHILEEEQCRMLHTPFNRRGMNPIKDVSLYKAYYRIIKDLSPDVVLTYTVKPNIYGGMACRKLKVPYITNITGLGTAIQGGGLLSKLLIAMYKIALKNAKCIFFQNEYNKEFMQRRGIGMNNADLLPGSGVNLERHIYYPYPEYNGEIKILSVIRIMRDKGIEEFFAVVDALGGDKIKFSLAGSFEEETRAVYEPILKRLVEEGKLVYYGFVEDMDSLYKEHHLILHPSYHEGLSNVCLEAAAFGRPVAATDVPGCRETIIRDKTGILFEAKSSEACIDAVKRVLGLSFQELEEMGRSGRKYVEENFNRNIVIEKYKKYI